MMCRGLVARAIWARGRVARRFGVVMTGLLLVTSPVLAQSQSGAIAQTGLVGKLEGPTLVTDPAQWPKQFHDAPMLQAQVAAGKLPPVAERVSQEPLVWQPLRRIGQYGGTLRRGFTGPSDSENGNRFNAPDKPLFFDVTGTKLTPNLAKGWEISADGRRTTLFLRAGMRWSDGAPFTADDFVFWFNEVYANKDLVPAPAPELSIHGKPGRIEKVNDTTVAYVFDDPYFLFPELLAGTTLVGGGQSNMQSGGFAYGLYAPAHYLRQFIPQNGDAAALTQAAKAAGFDNWVQYFHFKSDWRLNTELPVVGPWHTVQPINTAAWVLERNPYFWAVDTAGNQLPYLDRIYMTLAENPEVINLRAIAGEYDYQERFVDLGKLPVLLENQERGHYHVHLDLGFNGADTALMVNMTYKDDPEIAKWLASADFRRALSLGIDRDQLNEAFFLGLGTPGSVIPADGMPENPGPDWRKKWSVYDPAQANRMLDAIGLGAKDAQGYRLRTDNGQRLRVELQVQQSIVTSWPQQAEMIAQQWSKIGIQADVKVSDLGLAATRTRNDQDQINFRNNNGTESLFLYTRYALPVDPTGGDMSAAYSNWFASDGRLGTKPVNPELLRAYDLLHAAAGQPQAERDRTAQEIWKIVVDQQWTIGTVGQSPAFSGVQVVSDKLENVPDRVCISQHCRSPGSGHPELWFYK